MNRREAIKKIGLTTAALGAIPLLQKCATSESDRPNIILMVADNLGRESVGYYGGQLFETPHLDRMATGGVVFDNCLIATPLCAPARCAWNTGRHPFRVGFNSQPRTNDPDCGLSQEEVCIARLLKDAGYHTGLFGKWNLGYDKKFNPVYHGFDEFYGSNAGHADYYTHLYNKDMHSHFYRGTTPVRDEGYFDTLFTNEAVEFLRRRQGKSQPFYLNLPFYAPHGPYQAPPGYYHRTDPLVNYRYMIEYLDHCVGQMLGEVERLGMAENTLIVFLSDQGASTMNDFTRNLREGGLKVVCNALWPGKIPAGIRVAAPWMHYDLYTTFAHLAGVEVPQDRVVDAENVWPLFEGRAMPGERTLYWTFREEDAVREGNWKLLITEGKIMELYDLSNDPDEKDNLALGHPDHVDRMRKMMQQWKQTAKSQQTSTDDSGKKYSTPDHNYGY